MERFVIIVNGWKSLTIITKYSILDVVAVLDPPLNKVQQQFFQNIRKFIAATKDDRNHNTRDPESCKFKSRITRRITTSGNTWDVEAVVSLKCFSNF